MRYGPSLATIGAGALFAVLFGVSLGNSAISQINPHYFQGAAIHPRDRGAAVDPNRPTVIPGTYQQLYGWSEGRDARGVDCPGCGFAPAALPSGEAGLYQASAPYFGSREEESRRAVREQREIDADYERRREEARARLAAVDAQVMRYTHYRVSEDEVVRTPPAPEDDGEKIVEDQE